MKGREFPMPPAPSNGELTENESNVIFTATLKPNHRSNPSIISFIEAFIRCKSISQAAEEAGVKPELGYSWRHRKDIANCIQKLTDKSIMKYGCDSTEIFQRVKELTDFDPIELMNQDGTFKDNLHDVRPEARRCLKSMKVKNLYNQVEDLNGMKDRIIIGKLIEYQFYDKIKASELVGREKEMFKNTTKVEHTVTKDMASILLDSAKRADEREKPPVPIDITPISVTEVE